MKHSRFFDILWRGSCYKLMVCMLVCVIHLVSASPPSCWCWLLLPQSWFWSPLTPAQRCRASWFVLRNPETVNNTFTDCDHPNTTISLFDFGEFIVITARRVFSQSPLHLLVCWPPTHSLSHSFFTWSLKIPISASHFLHLDTLKTNYDQSMRCTLTHMLKHTPQQTGRTVPRTVCWPHWGRTEHLPCWTQSAVG